MFDYEYWQNGVHPASVNMALEEFFLKRAEKTACVRVWSVPKDTGILGYSQDTDAIRNIDDGFSFVRRASGGSHIQMGPNILAYTATVPRDGTFKHYEDMGAYYAEKVGKALENLGVKDITVDNKASTVNAGGKVVANHAIVWGVNSGLLHGSVIIEPYDVDKLSQRLALGSRRIGNNVYSEYVALKNIPAVSKLLDSMTKGLNNQHRAEALKEIVGKEIIKTFTEDGDFKRKKIDNRVLSEAKNLINKKYGNQEWNNLKKPPFTKEEIEEIPGEKLDGPLKKDLGYCLYMHVKDKDFRKMAEPTEG